MVAIIPAGGEGKRMRPLSINTPKPFLKLMDKPIIEYVINLLLKNGINEIIITMGDFNCDLNVKGAHITFIKEASPLGTAGGLSFCANSHDKDYIVIFGDLICDFDIRKMIDFHKSENPLITVGKTKEKETGIYIVNKKAMPDADSFLNMEELIKNIKRSGGKILTFRDDCIFYDIDTLTDYKNLNRALLLRKDILDFISPEKYMNTNKNVIVGINSHLEVGASITPPVYIGSNVYIEAGAEIGAFSVIGENCKIYKNSHTENSVVMANSLVSGNTFLQDTIISENTKIKSGAKIFENTVIGENCIIGKNSVIEPNITIWPDHITEDNRVVSENITGKDLFKKSIFNPSGAGGELGIEITVPAISRLGLALSNFIKEGRFTVATDGTPTSHMIKNALISGLMEGGAYASDLGETLIPIFRDGISFAKSKFGIYISSDTTLISLGFFDRYGMPLKKSDIEKIERLYSDKDLFSAGHKCIKELTLIPNPTDIYIKRLYTDKYPHLHKDIFYFKSNIKSLQDYAHIAFNLCRIPSILIRQGSLPSGKMSAVFSDNGNSFTLFNEKGEPLNNNEIFEYISLILIKEGVKNILVPPEISMVKELAGIKYIYEKNYFSFYKKLSHQDYRLQKNLTSDPIYFITKLFWLVDKHSKI